MGADNKGRTITTTPYKKSGGLRIRAGVYLSIGTKLRHIAKRTGDCHDAEVVDGGISYHGKIYHSPSKAAAAAAGGSRNGWVFWEYFDSSVQRWELLDTLRKAR